jgi:hypothetical protein
LVAALAGLLFLAPPPAQATAPREDDCISMTMVMDAYFSCYLPQHRAVAEARLNPRPIDPVPMVTALTRLPLRQVLVSWEPGTASGRPARPDAIDYYFGQPGQLFYLSECPAVTPLPYVLVGEGIGPSLFNGVQAESPSRPCDSRTLMASVPGRRLNIVVESNAKPTGVDMAIIQGILKVAAR